MFIFGTRPEIIKLSPLIKEAEKRNIKYYLIHTGQHYDNNMSKIFIDKLKIREPDYNLGVKNNQRIFQLSEMIAKLGKTIQKIKPNVVIAQGDTTSVLASSLVCSTLNIAFGHVEAGIRSFDLTMPEEINRRVAAVSANFHFAPTVQSVFNLLLEGVQPKRIFLTGNTIVDATKQNIKVAKKEENKNLTSIYNFIEKSPFILCTLHRPSNVDKIENIKEILEAFKHFDVENMKIVFPIHPRTLKRIKEFNMINKFMNLKNLLLTEPLDYFSFLRLLSDCSLILTDSGGVQEEAITLKKRCVTLRTNTERPETLYKNINILCLTKKEQIIEKVNQQLELGEINEKIKNPYGDGNTSKIILDILSNNDELFNFETPLFLNNGNRSIKLCTIKEQVPLEKFKKETEEIILFFNEMGEPIFNPKNLKSNYSALIRY